MVRNLARLAIAGPWRGGIERLTRAIGHRFPSNIAVGRLCHHVGAALIEREGAEFNRVAVFESGGSM